MRFAKKTLFAAATLILCNISLALPNKPITIDLNSDEFNQPAVLEPGSRIIAGDPNNNEFFIVNKDDPVPSTLIANHLKQHPNKKTLHAPVKIVTNKTLDSRLRKRDTKKSYVLNKKSNDKPVKTNITKLALSDKNNKQRLLQKPKVVLSKNTAKANSTKELIKIKVALNDVLNKAVRDAEHKKALNQHLAQQKKAMRKSVLNKKSIAKKTQSTKVAVKKNKAKLTMASNHSTHRG